MRNCSYSAYKKEAEIRSCVATRTCRGKKDLTSVQLWLLGKKVKLEVYSVLYNMRQPDPMSRSQENSP